MHIDFDSLNQEFIEKISDWVRTCRFQSIYIISSESELTRSTSSICTSTVHVINIRIISYFISEVVSNKFQTKHFVQIVGTQP